MLLGQTFCLSESLGNCYQSVQQVQLSGCNQEGPMLSESSLTCLVAVLAMLMALGKLLQLLYPGCWEGVWLLLIFHLALLSHTHTSLALQHHLSIGDPPEALLSSSKCPLCNSQRGSCPVTVSEGLCLPLPLPAA